jgi:acetyltransferase-like isoleucine patch superfamily enzyme
MAAEHATLTVQTVTPGAARGAAAAGADAAGAAPRGLWGRLRYVLARLDRLGPALNARWHLRSASRLGQRVTLRGRPHIENQGTLTVGERVRLVSTVATLELATLPGGRLEIGDNVFINYGTSIVAGNRVTIGDDCLIGTHVMVMDCDFHRVEDKAWDTTGTPITLEDRVWLGNRSIVLKGVTVGHDAVVAAGSVVTHDVPPETVVAGVPARVVRRFRAPQAAGSAGAAGAAPPSPATRPTPSPQAAPEAPAAPAVPPTQERGSR